MIAPQQPHQILPARALILQRSYLIEKGMVCYCLDIDSIFGVELGYLFEEVQGSGVYSLHSVIPTDAKVSNLLVSCS